MSSFDPPLAPEADSGPEPDATAAIPKDGTLGGYMAAHDRPPAFEGSDRHPYTVSVEVEQVGGLRAPFACYLIFPRWSPDGGSVVGHVQSPILARGRSHDDVFRKVGELTLLEVKELLESAIRGEGAAEEEEWSADGGPHGDHTESAGGSGEPERRGRRPGGVDGERAGGDSC